MKAGLHPKILWSLLNLLSQLVGTWSRYFDATPTAYHVTSKNAQGERQKSGKFLRRVKGSAVASYIANTSVMGIVHPVARFNFAEKGYNSELVFILLNLRPPKCYPCYLCWCRHGWPPVDSCPCSDWLSRPGAVSPADKDSSRVGRSWPHPQSAGGTRGLCLRGTLRDRVCERASQRRECQLCQVFGTVCLWHL